MDILKQYAIPYKGLKPGDHHFDFEVDDALFQAFENSEIKSGKARATFLLHKGASHMKLDATIRGSVEVPCDRCLEACTLPVDFRGELIVKVSDQVEEYDGEVMWISPADECIELGQYIYESIVLSLPYQRVHAQGACDPEMMSRFKIVSQEEFDRISHQAESAVGEQPLGSEQQASLERIKKSMEEKQ